MIAPDFFRDRLRIEHIEEQDVSAVIALWQGCGLVRSQRKAVYEISTLRACPTATILVARANEALVGVAVAGFDGRQGWLSNVAVDPCLHRNGIGRALVKHGEQWLQALGASSINVQLPGDNKVAVQFCRGLGYVDQGLKTFARQLAQV